MYYYSFAKNKYSQNGEDGVLNQLIKELGLNVPDMWVVDVGAFDGKAYSNLRNFIDQNCHAVMIEPSLIGGDCRELKYLVLQDLPKIHPKVTVFNHFTMIADKDKAEGGYSACKTMHENCGISYFNPEKKTLNESLSMVKNFPTDYDILNIDIDSYDHDVWKEHNLTPKIVIIEINSGLDPKINNDKIMGYNFNDSLEVGISKGYSCVCHTGNMIFVRNDLLNNLLIPKEEINSISLFRTNWLRR
jgi:hypothetical protein